MPYIDESTEYQFVKFKDGKEVFAMVREVFTSDKLELHFPMNIQLAPAMTGGVLVLAVIGAGAKSCPISLVLR